MRPQVLAAVSGFLAAFGVAVLLQQFALVPLTLVGSVVAPLTVAGLLAGMTHVRARRGGGAS